MASKISTPKGTRDFSPEVMSKRNYIFNIIKEVYELFGFQAIETPAMENLSTLMGKCGEEGDKLLFKILNSGDYLSNIEKAQLVNIESAQLSSKISEKGLRYDLTVPFARYIVQHQNDINFPFRRYQIQAVWRADKPQKGRFREFYQCDADVIGSDSLLNEVEFIQIIDMIFNRLNMKVNIKLNNRKILLGIAEIIGKADALIDITVAIDKLDKIGFEKVSDELLEKGLSKENINKLKPILFLDGNNDEKLEKLSEILALSEVGLKGIEEIKTIIHYINKSNIHSAINIDITLARGLDYYTGSIIEGVSDESNIGSLCGGGRYDDLTGVFGLKDMSGVGISFGADRIYEVLNDLKKFPLSTNKSTEVLFVNFGLKEEAYCLPLVEKLRTKGVKTEIYPSAAKLKKQMQYANNKFIPWVVMAGEEEMKNSNISLKNMLSGEQKIIFKDELMQHFVNC